jgi:hypothetical protein
VRVVGASGDLGGAIARIPEAVERATGERVVPTEVDAGLGGAVFRTAPESVRDREFYEVRTDGRETTVERWRAGDSGRARVPFTLTRRALEGLVDGVGGVVGGATG